MSDLIARLEGLARYLEREPCADPSVRPFQIALCRDSAAALRKAEAERDALRVEYESRAHLIACYHAAIGYNNADGFWHLRDGRDPEQIMRDLYADSKRLARAEELLREAREWLEPDYDSPPSLTRLSAQIDALLAEGLTQELAADLTRDPDTSRKGARQDRSA